MRAPTREKTAGIHRLQARAYGQSGRRGKLTAAGIVVTLHVAALTVLMQLQSVRAALTAAVPMVVHLVLPPTIERPREPPKPLPSKPHAQRAKPAPQAPVPIVSTAEAAPFVGPPIQDPVVTPVEPLAAIPASSPISAPSSLPRVLIPPSFSADYLDNPAPAYPPLSRRMGEEGKVMLRVLVDEQGLPLRVELKSSGGFARLDNAALETVRHWRFVPARRGDQPASAWVLVPISFSLRS